MVAFAHFPSAQSRISAEDYTVECRRFRLAIEESEVSVDNSNTVIMGDFNLDPFDRNMISADGMHAVSSRSVAENMLKRMVRGQEYPLLYNPMWNLLGDFQDPPGSFFYSQSSMVTAFWHTMDQVLLRPSIASRLAKDSLRFITHVNGIALTTALGHPKVSDHFPLYFEIV